MSSVVIKADSGQFPQPIVAAIIEMKPTWLTEAWKVYPKLVVRSLSVKLAGTGTGSCEFERPYGTVHHPFNVSASEPFTDEEPEDFTGWWFRVKFTSERTQDPWVVFTGRVAGEARAVKGGEQKDKDGAQEVSSGTQIWTAYEPMWALRRMAVNSSWWRVPTGVGAYETRQMGWVPDINSGGGSGELVGNASKEVVSDQDFQASHLYSPPERLDLQTTVTSKPWSLLDYVEYVLARFATTTVGPNWKINRTQAEETLGGRAGYVERIQTIKLSQAETVASILKKLFNPQFGVDFDVVPFHTGSTTTSGFEVVVVPIVDGDEVFTVEDHRGVTHQGRVAGNYNSTEFKVSDTVDIADVSIVENIDNRFSEIVVQGERILSCCTLEAKTASQVAEGEVRSLDRLWGDDLEGEYLDATEDAAADWEEQAKARRQERFAAVYQAFGVPRFWDWHGGVASPALDAQGQIILERPEGLPESAPDPRIGQHQSGELKTEAFIPLFEHVDYSVINALGYPDYSKVPPGVIPKLMQPQAWVWDTAADGTHGDTRRRVSLRELEQGGVSIQPLKNAFGLFLRCTPQHLLSLGHWDDAPSWGEGKAPAYNWEDLIVTAAVRANQRFAMRWEVPIDDDPGDDSKKVIPVPGAEFWFVAPNTVYGLDVDGKEQFVGGTEAGTNPDGTQFRMAVEEVKPFVARNDSAKMVSVMAGAIARYKATRAKASITMRGLQPWDGLIGTILTTVEKGGRLRRVNTVVTSVSWDIEGEQQTTVKAGYA